MAAQQKISGINLIDQDRSKNDKSARFQAVLKRTSFAVLGVYLVGLIIFFGANYIFLRKEASLATANQKLTSDIKSLSPVETLINTAKNRVDLASNIINVSVGAPEKLLGELTAVLPPLAQVSEVDATQDSFNIVVIVPNSNTLAQVFRAITNSQFTSIELAELNLREDGLYSVSLNVK